MVLYYQMVAVLFDRLLTMTMTINHTIPIEYGKKNKKTTRPNISHTPVPMHPVPIHHGFMAPTWRSRRSKHSKPVRKVLISSAKTWLGDRGSRGPGTGEGWWFVGFLWFFGTQTCRWLGVGDGALACPQVQGTGSLPQVYESHVRRSSWPSWTYFIQVQFLDPLGTHLNVDELKDGLSSTC